MMSSRRTRSPPPPYTSQTTSSLTLSSRYFPDSPARHRYHTVMVDPPDRPQERRPPTLTVEIFDRILSHADTGTLLTCSLLGSGAWPMAQTYLVESITINYDSDYQRIHNTTTKLLALFSLWPDLSHYVRHLTIKDTPASFERQYQECLQYMDEDDRAEYVQMVRKRNALCPGLMFFDDELAGILERTTNLVTFEIDLRDYRLDWVKYEEWHSARKVTNALSLKTLKAITLRGILRIPLAELEKAQNLKSLSISRSSVRFDDVHCVTSPTAQTCLELLRTKDIMVDGAKLARYLGACDTVISVRKVKKIYVEIVCQEDVEIARAVLRSATEVEDLQMSTMFYFQRNMHTTLLDMHSISFANLSNLKTLSFRLDFRDGATHELDWFSRAMSTFPKKNALETVLVIIDAGFVHRTPRPRGRCERADLQKYTGWRVWEAVFLSRAFDRLQCLTIVVNSAQRENCEMGYGSCLLPEECVRLNRLKERRPQLLNLVETVVGL